MRPRLAISAVLLGVGALAGALVPAAAVPVMDGERDAEYTLVATSPKDNLLVDPARAINDPTDPEASLLDVTDLWAANSGSCLYLYAEMPALDLAKVYGEWAVLFHLEGANEGIGVTGASDPYGAACDFAHVPALNATLKSNMRGFQPLDSQARWSDGNQGWAMLVGANRAGNGFNGMNWDFFGGRWTEDLAAGTIRGEGSTGGVIVYKAHRGIEMKIPFGAFTATSDTAMTPPAVGEAIRFQFYTNMRAYPNSISPRYPRGPTDAVPFESGVHPDPARGRLTAWSQAYTLTGTVPLEVRSARPVGISDLNHLAVSFSAALGIGATLQASYTVVDQKTGASVPVRSVSVDPADATRAILSLPLPTNTTLRVTASGVKSADGTALDPLWDSAEASIGPAVVFNLYDPYGDIASLGTDPATGHPYHITLVGDMNDWKTDADGAAEIPVEPAGDAGHYRTAPLLWKPGVIRYKYRVPHLADSPVYDNWNALNPNDRRALIPQTESTTQVSDNASGTGNRSPHMGAPIRASFTLVDKDDVAKSRPVYLTGQLTGWSGDPARAIPMLPVAGAPHTYSATFSLPSGLGRDTTTEYKYVMIVPDPANPGQNTVLWDDLNPTGGTAPSNNRWTCFAPGPGSDTAVVLDSVGGARLERILRAAAGLDTAPGASPYMLDLDRNGDGRIDMSDALRASRHAGIGRLKARGTSIVDANGNEVLLRGINLGGWLVEEMWMTPWVQDPPAGSPYPRVVDHMSLWSVLNARLGAASAAGVRAAYRNAWLQPEDFARIRAAGLNVVRLPFLYDLIGEPNGIDWLREAVAAAEAAGLYLILDMHGAPGSQNPWDHSGQVGLNQFFYDPDNIAKAVQVWTAVAKEFANNPTVAGFDLLNEPAGAPDTTTLHRVHNQLYQAIRKVAPDTLVIIEDGYKGFDAIPSPDLYGWHNVIYSTHLYNFGAQAPADHLAALNGQLPGLVQTRNARNVPLYIGEFNIEPQSSRNVLAQYIETLGAASVSWSLWTYKTVATGGPMGFWGFYSNPNPVAALNPFTDSEAILKAKLAQVQTENLQNVNDMLSVFQASARQ